MDFTALLEQARADLRSRAGDWEPQARTGALLLALERPGEALEHLGAAAALEPGRPEVQNNLGAAMCALGRFEEAVPYFRRAVELHPAYADALRNLTGTLGALGRHDEALAVLEALAARDPSPHLVETLAETHARRGKAAIEAGRIDEGREAVLTAIALAPRCARYYRYLAECDARALTDEYLAVLENLAASEGPERADALFALGRAHAVRGDLQTSFVHLRSGSALYRAGIDYDEETELATIRNVARMFTEPFLRAHEGMGHATQLPVFIVGMPRSGTTLVEQILAAHPQVRAGGELLHFDQIAREVLGRGGAWSPAEIGRRYEAALRDIAAGAQRVTDKMPANFRFAGLIRLALPQAKIVHVRRDPLDTCLSCFSNTFAGESLPWSYDLNELGRYYAAYEAIMAHWRRVLPPGAMFELQYETLVADLEGETRRLLAYCGLEWDAGCLEFHTVQRPVRTASAVQVRTPLYRSSVHRSRAYGDALRPLQEALAQPFDL